MALSHEPPIENAKAANGAITTKAPTNSNPADGFTLSPGEREGVRVSVNLISSWPMGRFEGNKKHHARAGAIGDGPSPPHVNGPP